MVKISIVGLPNVGKSAFFNLITKSNVLSTNYPFATIKPNVGVVKIEDPRCKKLQKIYKAKKIVYSTLEFYDIAGLVKNASEGEGLGNSFLSSIKETNIICHVVRIFENKDIIHVNKKINPIDDYNVINLELILHDIKLIDSSLKILKKRVIKSNLKILNKEILLLEKCFLFLKQEKLLNSCKLTDDELVTLKKYGLLTTKSMIILLNISENILKDPQKSSNYQEFTKYLNSRNVLWTQLAIKFENDLNDFSSEERKLLFSDYKIKESGFWKFTWVIFELLKLSVFFTCGELEIHSWMFTKYKNSSLECSGLIHNSFPKRLICSEIFNYKEFDKYNEEKEIKNAGLIKKIGKKDIINDGDICNFILDRE